MADWSPLTASLETAAFPLAPNENHVSVTYNYRTNGYSDRRYLMPGYSKSWHDTIAAIRYQQLELKPRLNQMYGLDTHNQDTSSSLARSRTLVEETRELEKLLAEKCLIQHGQCGSKQRTGELGRKGHRTSAIRRIIVPRPGKKGVKFIDYVPRTPGGMQVPGTPGFRTRRAQRERAEQEAAEKEKRAADEHVEVSNSEPIRGPVGGRGSEPGQHQQGKRTLGGQAGEPQPAPPAASLHYAREPSAPASIVVSPVEDLDKKPNRWKGKRIATPAETEEISRMQTLFPQGQFIVPTPVTHKFRPDSRLLEVAGKIPAAKRE